MGAKVTFGVIGFVFLVSGLAQGDTIGLYTDPSGTNCNIPGTSALTYIYVVHITAGATASEFSAPKPACWTGATWLGDQSQFFPDMCCDDSQTREVTAYGSCLAGAIHILTMVYSVQGTVEPCCLYPVLSGANSVDCEFNMVPVVGLVSTVNGNSQCPCGYPVPVEETTWGRVKALYTE